LAEAEKHFRKAIELAPKSNSNPHSSLIGFLERQSKLAEAEALYRKAIDRDPKDANSHWYLGNVLERQGLFMDALKMYREALALDSRVQRVFPIVDVRQVERLAAIEPKLPSFLRGEYQPGSNDERQAFLYICEKRNLYRTAARLWADIFAAAPP